MAEKPAKDEKKPPKDEDRLAIPLDPVEALRGLLGVKPDPESEQDRRPRRRTQR